MAEYRTFRSLDRTFTVFGIRGRYLWYFLGAALGWIAFCLIVLSIAGFGMIIKLLATVLGCAGLYFGVLWLQMKFSPKEVLRWFRTRGRVDYIVRRSSLRLKQNQAITSHKEA